MPNQLTSYVQRGVDAHHFQVPMRLHRAERGRVLHGHPECARERRPLTIVEHRSPLSARDLCACWPLGLPSHSQTLETVSAAADLLDVERSLAEARKLVPTPLKAVAELRADLHALSRVGDGAGASSWKHTLEGEVRTLLSEVEGRLQSEEARKRLLERCVQARMGRTPGEALPYEEAYTLTGEDAGRAAEVTAAARTAWLGADEETRCEAVTEALLGGVEVGEVTLNQVAHLPLGPVPAGTLLGEHVSGLWEEEVRRIGMLLSKQWEEERQGLSDPDRRTLLALPERGVPLEDETLELVEAWRRPSPQGRDVVVTPDVVADEIDRASRGARRPSLVTLESTDTEAVLETTLTLWSDDAGALGRLEDALDAARRVR